MSLDGKSTIVTGGGRGIGESIAKAFANEGAAVAVVARTETDIKRVVTEIERGGGKVLGLQADVSQQQDVTAMVEKTLETFSVIDILVNCAGTTPLMKPLSDISPEEWDDFMAINQRGPFLCAKAVLPIMQKRGSGCVINISGSFSQLAFPYTAEVATAKAGLEGLTRALAAEFGKEKIRVNAIVPGRIPGTRLTDELASRLATTIHVPPNKLKRRCLYKHF